MLKHYTFDIRGNQDDPEGNPIPKLRQTQGSLWSPKSKRYKAWKEYVQACFLKSIDPVESLLLENAMMQGLRHPIVLPHGAKAYMRLKIEWANETHGDPESIFGSIADALFQNDKELDGEFKTIHGKIGGVTVIIKYEIPEKVESVTKRGKAHLANAG